MALTAGIVGLPNVGKSTLFNAITKAGALAANYPFATIEPNVGMVLVPDERLDVLTKMYNPKKSTPAVCEFTDIAGLVKGASKGEGLGNQFLGNIRNCDAIVEVVRCFVDGNITHVEGNVDPVRDAEIINLELIFADLDSVEKRIVKIEKKAQHKVEKDAVIEYSILTRLRDAFMNNMPARSVALSDDEKFFIKNYQFLTMKPMLYVCNVSEDDMATGNAYVEKVKEYASHEGAKIEEELSALDEEERSMFLEDLGVKESGLDKLIKEAYELLGLRTFFTAGEKECRAWTFKNGMKAPQCAGVIHTDFEKGFIKAETYSYDDLIKYGTPLKVKEAGRVRLEGKQYVVQDGDIMLFRFNV